MRILHLEDDHRDAEIISELLAGEERDCEVRWVDDRAGFVEALEAGGWDAVLGDYALPSFAGSEALRLTLARCPDVPFLFVTGNLGEDLAAEAVRAGATDFVVKHRLSRLVPALRRALREAAERAEHRRVEWQLRESEDRARQLLDGIPGVFWMADPYESEVFYVSRAFEEVWGRPPSDPPQWSDWLSSIHPGDYERVWAEICRQRGGTRTDFRYRIVRADGGIRWLRSRAFPLRDEGGKVTRLAGLAEDVTGEHLASKALSAEHAVVHLLTGEHGLCTSEAALLQTATSAFGWEAGVLWLSDPKTRMLKADAVWVDPEASLSAFEAVGRTAVLAPGTGSPGQALAQARVVWDSDPAGGRDTAYARAVGEAGLRVAIAVPVPVSDEGKDFGILQILSRDRFESQPAVIQAMTALGLQVGQFLRRRRTEEALRASEQQVRQLTKMEAIGRLAGGVAHDFNNILTVIIGHCGLLREALTPENELLPDIELIENAATRASGLTRQLLAFSRKQVLELQPVDLNAVLKDSHKMLLRVIGEDIQVETDLAPDLAHVKADPSQLTQIVLNLAFNARDAMARGGTLRLRTSNVELDETFVASHLGASVGPHVLLSVTDTGCGMAPETIEHVFEPFYTTKEPGKGTLLGREEGLEQVFLREGVHPVARVGYGERHVGTARRAHGQGLAIVEEDLGGADGERAPAGHRVASVDHEVHQHLFNLAPVCHDRLRGRGQLRHQLDVLADQPAQHLLQPGDDPVEIQPSLADGRFVEEDAKSLFGGFELLEPEPEAFVFAFERPPFVRGRPVARATAFQAASIGWVTAMIPLRRELPRASA